MQLAIHRLIWFFINSASVLLSQLMNLFITLRVLEREMHAFMTPLLACWKVHIERTAALRGKKCRTPH